MVVCMVVRVRNCSNRTYYLVQAGDPFYSPRIGNQPVTELFEVPPGFDEAAEGLVVPWAATSRCGLVLGEVSSQNIVRCVVGPSSRDGYGMDWLRLHDDAWEPLVQDRWLALGKRHLIGVIGATVELELTFHDCKRRSENEDYASPACESNVFGRRLASPAAGPARLLPPSGKPEGPNSTSAEIDAESIAESSLFELEALCAPANTVFLNVFDLVSVASIPNSLLCNTIMKSFGAFHAAVEVYGDEWSFYKQQYPDDCGICRSNLPRRHPVHVYRQSINLGATTLKEHEVWNIIRREVAPNWTSQRYDLVHCNCIHFCDELLRLLGVKPAPSWVRGLHETGATLLKPLFFLNSLTARNSSAADDDNEAPSTLAIAEAESVENLPEPPDLAERKPSSNFFAWPSFTWGSNEASVDTHREAESSHDASGTRAQYCTSFDFLDADAGPIDRGKDMQRSDSFLSASSS